jgi:hypothetical protein
MWCFNPVTIQINEITITAASINTKTRPNSASMAKIAKNEGLKTRYKERNTKNGAKTNADKDKPIKFF